MVRMMKAVSQLASTPPKRILVLLRKEAAPKLPGRVSLADSPNMAQNPPRGSQFSETIVLLPAVDFGDLAVVLSEVDA